MEIQYVLINFLLLVGILFLFARKIIVKIFRGMFGVFANYHNATLALNDLALLAHGFNGRSYLHTV